METEKGRAEARVIFYFTKRSERESNTKRQSIKSKPTLKHHEIVRPAEKQDREPAEGCQKGQGKAELQIARRYGTLRISC